MTEDGQKLFDYILDESKRETPNGKLNIDPGQLNEIEYADRKFERLLDQLKKDNKIVGYEMCDDGTANVQLPVGRGVPPESINVQDPILEKVHQKVMDTFMEEHIKEIDNNAVQLEIYSDLFNFFVHIHSADSDIEKGSINLFDFVAAKINELQHEYILKVVGPDGTGKSTFLSLLYLYLHNLYCMRKLSVYPFYINLHYYEKQKSKLYHLADVENWVERRIKEDFEQIEKCANKVNVNFLIIVDGNDRYNRANAEINIYFKTILNKYKNYKKIICIGEKTNVHLNKKRINEEYIDYKTDYTFSFSPIYITERDSWANAVCKFCNIFRCTGQKDTFMKCIDRFRIKEIDYNLLTIFYKLSQKTELKDINSIHQLYNRYCLLYLKRNEKLDNSISLTYKYFRTDKVIPLSDISAQWMEWELMHQNKTISNYLLALYYSKLIESGNTEDIVEFECVFSYGINYFLKSIIRETEELQSKTIEFCKKIFGKGTFMAKSQAAYMVGRVTDPNIRENAKKLLRDQDNLCTLQDAEEEDIRRQYFLKRSILVSRLYLEEIDAGETMLKELFVSPTMSEVNRAFFIQYNGDISKGYQTVNFYDDGSSKISYTIKGLFNYVHKSLENPGLTWNRKDCYQFQIHLFTLCSLIQQRMNKSKEAYQMEINKLGTVIRKITENTEIILSDNMKDYLMMLQEDITKQNYNSGHLFKELYRKKQFLQSEIQSQDIKEIIVEDEWESIIEHAYYCWLLGMLYLPDEAPQEAEYAGYDKGKILTYFLVHNMSSLCGKSQGAEEPHTTEKDAMHKIFMHSMYMGIGNMDGYKEIWDDLSLNAKDINGKIASDIDEIEKLFQHLLYENKKWQSEDDMAKWKIRPNTSVGVKILNAVIKSNFSKDKRKN